jgi:hypothetical protein
MYCKSWAQDSIIFSPLRMYPRWHFGCLALGVLGYLQCLITELLGVAPGASDIGGGGGGGGEWWLSAFYRTATDVNKPTFSEEIHELSQVRSRPWALCGDFNMIYRAQDKNNGHLDRKRMG